MSIDSRTRLRIQPPPSMPHYAPSGETLASVTEQISDIALERRAGKGWYGLLGLGGLLLGMFGLVIIYLLIVGVGIWGINIPVAWGFTITDFVWWIGIGHAG